MQLHNGGDVGRAGRLRAAVVVLPVPPGYGSGGREAALEECLTTVVAAADEAAAGGLPVTVVVAVRAPSRGHDALLDRWRRLTGSLDAVSVLVVPVTGPGTRRRGVAAGLADPGVRDLRPWQVLVLTTDAAATVGVDWVVGHARHVGDGAAASTAVVTLPPGAADGAGPDGHGPDGHGHWHGSNMAVRGDAYLAAGGFPADDTTEDAVLWDELLGRGYRVCRALTPAVTVRAATRARTRG